MEKLIVGLGNPGTRYAATRHNAGFRVVDALAAQTRASEGGKRWHGLTAKINISGETVWLLKPQTYMNRSGRSVAAAVAQLKLPLDKVLVVCDDLALPLGVLRFRAGGSSGGQKGMESIVDALDSQEFCRLRIGIGADSQLTPRDFVLNSFEADELVLLEKVIGEAVSGCITWIHLGIYAAMNKHNGNVDCLE